MKDWATAAREGAVSGAAASVVSTALLSAFGRREAGSPYAPTNATSHWLWGDRAALQDGPSWRYTALGYLIHHASATFWAVIYEKWMDREDKREDVLPAIAKGAAIAGLAAFVDYKLTPQRLQPGYEMRLSRPALLAVYAGFGLAMAARSMLVSDEGRKRSPTWPSRD